MMDSAASAMAANAVCNAMDTIQQNFSAMACQYERPSIMLKPRLIVDGNKWCALYGENLQEGLAGFGDSPAKAMQDFDDKYHENLRA